MAHELSLLVAEKVTVTLESPLQRILSITAAFYGLAPAQGVERHAGGTPA